MSLTLKQLIEELEAEGVVGKEAEVAVEKFLAQRRAGRGGTGGTSALAKRRPEEIDFPVSAVDQRISRDYGDESPEEAKQRWIDQEMNDPDGIFGGGAEAGGIFGSGPIATERYDPGARMRGAQMRQAERSEQTQLLTVTVLTKLAEKLGVPRDEVAALLGEGEAPQRRLPGRRR